MLWNIYEMLPLLFPHQPLFSVSKMQKRTTSLILRLSHVGKSLPLLQNMALETPFITQFLTQTQHSVNELQKEETVY